MAAVSTLVVWCMMLRYYATATTTIRTLLPVDTLLGLLHETKATGRVCRCIICYASVMSLLRSQYLTNGFTVNSFHHYGNAKLRSTTGHMKQTMPQSMENGIKLFSLNGDVNPIRLHLRSPSSAHQRFGGHCAGVE